MSLRFLSGLHKSLITTFADKPLLSSSSKNVSLSIPTNPCFSRRNVSEASTISASLTSVAFSSASVPQSEDFPFSGVEDVLTSFMFGKRRATEVAHKVWESVVRKGDTVVDATCGNGHDTLTMLNMVSGEGRVYGFDIQKDALESTSALLDRLATPQTKEAVKLFETCHSKMAQVLPKDVPVRLVAFNLGYLPGGDKEVITEPKTTLEALKAATDIVMPGGLISLVVYVGHPGGDEELETVEEFSSELPVGSWVCCKFQMLNRPLCPVLIFICKKS